MQIALEPDPVPMSVQITVNKRVNEKAKKNDRYEDSAKLNDLAAASRNIVANFNKTSKFDRDLCMLLTENDELESEEFMPAQDDDEEETKEPTRINDSLQDELGELENGLAETDSPFPDNDSDDPDEQLKPSLPEEPSE